MKIRVSLVCMLLTLALSAIGCEYSTSPANKGGPGESCLARNDCQGGLSCINNVCIDSEVPLDHATKQCDAVQCTKKSDCCDGDEDCRCTDERCEFFDTCSDDLDCGFSGVCSGGECVECSSDDDCGFAGLCASGRCVECKGNADCDADETCVNNACDQGCSRDEECGALEACEMAECVHVGCQSNRECVAYLSNPRATCGDDKECTVLCESDAECNADGFNFSACQDGKCAFLGCETNADCRALFGGDGFGGLALCREAKD